MNPESWTKNEVKSKRSITVMQDVLSTVFHQCPIDCDDVYCSTIKVINDFVFGMRYKRIIFDR